MLARYRKPSFIAIMLVVAIITPPDLMTLIVAPFIEDVLRE